ncbi:hypothetical protein VXM60_15645 [Shewanella khirikhana]|uniref:hypothetical protein n=1 Tax=Shewanella khirikhana TaxID=1965282 RepID=UPI0030D4D236
MSYLIFKEHPVALGSPGQGCVFYAFLISRQAVFANFLFALLKLALAHLNPLHNPLRLAPLAVSVDAHYRDPKLLRKGFFAPKRSSEQVFTSPSKTTPKGTKYGQFQAIFPNKKRRNAAFGFDLRRCQCLSALGLTCCWPYG